MNLLFTLKTYPAYGGVERVTTMLSNHFIANGYRVQIVAAEQGPEELFCLLDNRAKYTKLPSEIVASHRNAHFLAEKIRRDKIDIVINQGIYWDVFDLLKRTKKLTSYKLISVFHNSPDSFLRDAVSFTKSDTSFKGYLKRLFGNFYFRFIRLKTGYKYRDIYNHSNSFVLLSQAFQLDFLSISGVNPARLTTISNPVGNYPLDIYEVLEGKKKQILYVGRLVKAQKRLDRLITIWSELEGEFLEWELVLVGEGPDKASFQQQVAIKNLKNVKFAGPQTDVSPYFKDAAVVCLTSDFEGLAMVLLEGMQWGAVPIVYGSFKSVNDIIEDNVSGYIVEAFEEGKYIEKLKHLMTNNETRTRLAIAAEKSSHRNNIDEIYKQWQTLLCRVLHDSV